MPDSRLLEFSAVLGAHELLIRDLLVGSAMRSAEPLQSFDLYATKVRAGLPLGNGEGIDAAESDLLNQLTTEAVERTVVGVRQSLEIAIREQRQRRQGPQPKEGT